MPNYPLSQMVKLHLEKRTSELCQRAIHYATGACPLDTRAFETATIPQPERDMLWHLQEHRYTLSYDACPHIYVLHTIHPQVKRSATIAMSFKKNSPLTRRHTYVDNSKSWLDQVSAGLRFDPNMLDDGGEAFVGWFNNFVLVNRRVEMAKWVVGKVLPELHTSAELLDLWPNVASIVTDAMWKMRFRHPPRYTRTKKVPAGVRADYVKFIDAADMLLNGAALLQPYDNTKDMLDPVLLSWQNLEGDRTFKA